MQKVLVIIKGSLDTAVPIINIVQAFNANNKAVSIICGNVNNQLKVELEESGIKICSLNIKNSASNIVPGFIAKILYWIAFRSKANKQLKKEQFDFLYVATADTAIALHGLYESKHKYFLHLRELYDQFPLYMRMIKKPAQRAYKVIVPEENRAFLYYSFLNLKTMPCVIPNKPFYHPREQKRDISFLEKSTQQKIISKKNIIYQGHLHKERDISKLVELSCGLNDYNLILLGNDQGMLKEYLRINPGIVHIPFIRPPLHLNITSWGHIGVISYDFASLNTIYCAPNKIWEYSGFAIPIIGNKNPGLKYAIEKFNAGKIIDMNDESELKMAIEELRKEYVVYSENAKLFFESFNLEKAVNLLFV